MSRTTCIRPLGLVVVSGMLGLLVACGGKKGADASAPDALEDIAVEIDVGAPDLSAEPSPEIEEVAERGPDAVEVAESGGEAEAAHEVVPDAAEPEPLVDVSEPIETVDAVETVDGQDVADECTDDEDCSGKLGDLGPCEAASCSSGVCLKIALPDDACDDGDPCTDDLCDAAFGCLNLENTASCDDGDACTEADACFDGLCVGAPVDGCGDPECGDGACEAGETCQSCPIDCSPAGAGDCGGPCDPTLVPPSCSGNRACLPTRDGATYHPALTFGHGVCGVGCALDTDCPGGACLAVEGLESEGLCVVTCTPGVDACDATSRCVARAGDAQAGVCVPGAECVPGDDAPECVPLNGLTEGGAAIEGCWVQATDACLGGLQQCLVRTAGAFHSGTCVGQATACDPVSQQGCGDLETCQPLGGPGLSGLAFLCIPARDTVAEGQPCTDAPESCAPGLLCHAGACRAPCRPDEAACAAGICRDASHELLAPPGTLGLCEPGCGDALCDPSAEDCATCAADCGACADTCGDHVCQPDESCETCPYDCVDCPWCGDGLCLGDEACDTCADDCGACAVCGDDACTDHESCDGCPDDCGPCVDACSDGTCGAAEVCFTCPDDCGPCQGGCGDDACGLGETCVSCPNDCGPCPWSCGDGACDDGETCATCPSDCRLLGLPACGEACDPTGLGAACSEGQACVPTSAGRLFAAPFAEGNGICGDACQVDDTCDDEGRCLALGGVSVGGLCGAPCTQPGGDECDPGLACVAPDSNPAAGVCVPGPECDVETGCGPLLPGAACIRLAGSLSRGVCLPGCWVQDPAACLAEPTRCHAKTGPEWHEGTCAGQDLPCDPATQTGCGPAETCLVVGGAALLGQASACTSLVGPVPEGGDCSLGADLCVPGLLCVDDACSRPCRPDAGGCATGPCDDVGALFHLPPDALGVCR